MGLYDNVGLASDREDAVRRTIRLRTASVVGSVSGGVIVVITWTAGVVLLLHWWW